MHIPLIKWDEHRKTSQWSVAYPGHKSIPMHERTTKNVQACPTRTGDDIVKCVCCGDWSFEWVDTQHTFESADDCLSPLSQKTF